MADKVRYETVKIKPNSHCIDCGWPILDYCCNGPMGEKLPYKGWDWWLACSNKTCKNQKGEGVFQNDIKWIVYTGG